MFSKSKHIIIPVLICIIISCNNSKNFQSGISVSHVKNPLISLNGTWMFTMDPPEKFWEVGIDTEQWDSIHVPGECQMQGFAIKQDIPVVYSTSFIVPDDYNGKSVFLIFHGVHSYARIWVNGKFVRDHHGGFTKWKCDITELVISGEKANLVVEVTDKKDDVSGATKYAHHPIGGILRDVELMALPKQHFLKLFIEPQLDGKYKDAKLKIAYELSMSDSVSLMFQLYDAENKLVKKTKVEDAKIVGNAELNIQNPTKWDSEHPYLYTMVSTLKYDGKKVYSTAKKIGFRRVEVEKNKLLVNGQSVKLRGACRHDVHPTLGRIATDEYDRLDVLLAKEANMNYLRTSHYPPSERFLEYCDQYGIYVEDESAVCFQNTNTTDNDEFKSRFFNQFEEMVQNHRNHPSVIIWSLGNESKYGKNIQGCYDWVKEHDASRPVKFSWPGSIPEDINCNDILSFHYPNFAGNEDKNWGTRSDGRYRLNNFDSDTIPLIYDEWAHTACYDTALLKEDLYVRDFWGNSLEIMWNKSFNSEGVLGGAIWGMTDEIFCLPNRINKEQELIPKVVGYGEWGVYDIWRRKKPEFWNTKKAYSPVRIQVRELNPVEGTQLEIPVQNRFNHTNLNEITIRWEYKNKQGKVIPDYIQPGEKGTITLPTEKWIYDDVLRISVIKNDTFLIDIEEVDFRDNKVKVSEEQEIKPFKWSKEENGNFVSIDNGHLKVDISKESGFITKASIIGSPIIIGEIKPTIQVRGDKSSWCQFEMPELFNNWKLKRFSYDADPKNVFRIISTGHFDEIPFEMETKIRSNGKITFTYSFERVPDSLVRHLGLTFNINPNLDFLKWTCKNALWSYYPQNNIGAPSGDISIKGTSTLYRQKPNSNWEEDCYSFYYDGLKSRNTMSMLAKSAKVNINEFSIYSPKLQNGIRVIGTGHEQCRLKEGVDENLLIISNLWDYPNLSIGNYMKEVRGEDNKKYTIEILMF